MGLLFAIFPTQNAMVDSWYFAACVKYKTELFNTHHLLYNFFGYYWFTLLKCFNHSIEAIVALNLMNAFAALLSLSFFYKVLLQIEIDPKKALWFSLLAGVSFGFMRYATDAEAYILPLLFSMISSYYFITCKHKLYLVLAGTFAALAILTHQLQIWWTLAMLIYLFRKKPYQPKQIIAFILPLACVPLVYYLVFLLTNHPSNSITQFIGGEYSKGNAGIDISIKSLGLTLINFIRSFVQLHGLILNLIEIYFTIAVTILIILSLFIIFAFYKNLITIKFKKRMVKNKYSNLFLWAFLLHLSFAFLSSGNAEFMVMLPFLTVLYTCSCYEFKNIQGLKLVAIVIFIWNLAFGVLPNALLNHSKVDSQVRWSVHHPNAICAWKNKPLVENKMTYDYGFHAYKQLISYRELNSIFIDSALALGKSVNTDYPNNTTAFSREAIHSEDAKDTWVNKYSRMPVDSFNNLYGKNYLFTVQKRTD